MPYTIAISREAMSLVNSEKIVLQVILKETKETSSIGILKIELLTDSNPDWVKAKVLLTDTWGQTRYLVRL